MLDLEHNILLQHSLVDQAFRVEERILFDRLDCVQFFFVFLAEDRVELGEEDFAEVATADDHENLEAVEGYLRCICATVNV